MRVTRDSWEEIISRWLEAPVEYVPGAYGPMPVPVGIDGGVLTSEVLLHALRMQPGAIKKSDENRVAEVLNTLGYVRGKSRREGGENRRVRRFVKVVTPVVTDGGDTPEDGNSSV